MDNLFSWMAWTMPVAIFFTAIVLMLIGMTVWELRSPSIMRRGFLPMPPPAATACSSACWPRLYQPGLDRPDGPAAVAWGPLSASWCCSS